MAALPSILWLSIAIHKKQQCSANISFFPFSQANQHCSLVAPLYFYEKPLTFGVTKSFLTEYFLLFGFFDWQTCWLRPSHLCRQPMLKAAQEQYWFSRAHQKLPLLIYISFTPKGTNPTRFQFPNFANSLICSTMEALYMIIYCDCFCLYIFTLHYAAILNN